MKSGRHACSIEIRDETLAACIGSLGKQEDAFESFFNKKSVLAYDKSKRL